MTMDIYFPSVDFTVSKQLDTNKKQSVEDATRQIPKMIRDAKNDISRLEEDGVDVEELKSNLSTVENENQNSQEKKAVLQHLKEVLRKIEDKDSNTEWQRLEKELREEFDRLEKADEERGNEKTHAAVEQLRSQTDSVIRSKNVKMGQDVLQQIKSLFIGLNLIEILIAIILHWHEDFDSIRWQNPTRARKLLNQAISVIQDNPTSDKLLPIAKQIIELLPEDERANVGGLLKVG